MNIITADKKMERARVQLIIHNPFYASLALGMKYAEDRSITTGCTDGKSIRYNPEFVESLNDRQVQGFIAHECLHPGLLHHTRRRGRDPKLWNMACDHVINNILIQSGFELPPDGLCNPAFAEMNAEEVYEILKEQQGEGGEGEGEGEGQGQSSVNGSSSGNGDQDQDDQGDGDGVDSNGNGSGDGDQQQQKQSYGIGDVEDSKAKSKSEETKEENDQKQKMLQAAMIAKQQGNLPGHLRNIIKDLLDPVVNWKAILSEFFTEATKSDYSWRFPSKRYAYQGLYMPSLQKTKSGADFVLIIDTSISTFEPGVLEQFVSEAQEIVTSIDGTFRVMHVDTIVQHVEEIEDGDDVDLDLRGGGGTCFRPGFEWLEENEVEPAALVYLTDGWCNTFPENTPDYPVLWGILGNKDIQVPFGEVLDLTKINKD